MHIVIVAGEASGDILGAGLMRALQGLQRDIRFSGIGGEKMQALGFKSLYPIDRLSVMGLLEPLKRLPELLAIRKHIKQFCRDESVDLFIGIDSPDFNLSIERYCKNREIKTVHYVSPSVWAWRQGRIHKIKKSIDLMLTLLPFEADFYRQHEVPVCFVGHPLADDIALETDTAAARLQLQVVGTGPVIALLPGSRNSEVALLGELFLAAADKISERFPSAIFLLPCANAQRREQIEAFIAQREAQGLTINSRLFSGQSHQVMAAADAVLLASGTTALEAMLLKKPMVVSYKMSPLSYWIISRLVKSRFVALPNLLAGKALVPELLQNDATVANLSREMLALLADESVAKQQRQAFYALHQQLQQNASAKAAAAVLALMKTAT